MLDFKVIDISDREWINGILKKSDYRGCEYCFANNMAWRRLYDTKICRYKDFYISCSFKEGLAFTFPAGEGDFVELIGVLKEFSEMRGFPLVIGSVSQERLSFFEENYHNQYRVSSSEDSSDYIYETEDLINLSGKKYHAKRNHLKKFYEAGGIFLEMTEDDFDECITFAAENYNSDNAYDDESRVAEQFAINEFFTHFRELGLSGGILRLGGRIVGFTIGERLNSDTFVIHIEKADKDINGSFAAINNEFLKFKGKDCKYVNREEDMGLPGLRKAKRSYYPAFMNEKRVVSFC